MLSAVWNRKRLDYISYTGASAWGFRPANVTPAPALTGCVYVSDSEEELFHQTYLQKSRRSFMQRRTLNAIVLAAALAVVPSALTFAQTASQDMKNAGSETKSATKNAGHSISKGTKKGYHKTKSGTKKAYHKVDGNPNTK